jgi:hypothetical protein
VRIRARRRIDGILLLGGGLLVGAAATIGAAVGGGERITSMWAAAQVRADGTAHVVEVIEYDFGTRRRHGIFRDVPGLAPDAAVEVSSATAPADVQLERMGSQVRIRVGDPDRTVTGRHRYRIAYPLDGVVASGRRLAWDAVGTAWPVRIEDVEVHVVAPFAVRDARCVQGGEGAGELCGVAQPEPGHLVAGADALAPRQGLTLFATTGRALGDAPPPPTPPSAASAAAGSGLLLPGLLAGAAALVAALAMSRLVRRAGRERVAPGGTAAVTGPGGEARVDAERLASLAAVEAVPPDELTPAQGGILLAEQVRDEHKVAWLLGAAVDGYLDVQEGPGGIVLVRGGRGDGPAAPLLDVAFGGRRHLPLGAYDPAFASAWQAIGHELAAWQQASGLWDPAGRRRRVLALVLGTAAALVGLAAAAAGGALANRVGPGWLALAGAGGLVAGAGVAAVVRAWELRVRTPSGTRLWLRVESFRRFLAGVQAGSVGQAAQRGPLDLYTAWAVALGEVDPWSKAVAGSTVLVDRRVRHYATTAPFLVSAASRSSVQPSSGSSGGAGGGVGGGAGGGGGGSW